jgi:comEA protein
VHGYQTTIFKRRLIMRSYGKVFCLAVIFLVLGVFSSSQVFAEVTARADTGKVVSQSTAKININKATAEQLMEIKGIGASYAKKIVEYREKNGPFKKIEDITLVSGIGDKKFEAIKDLITVESAK